MRSRYSAFVLGLSDHLWRTWHPRTRPEDVQLGPIQWLGLEIVEIHDGEPWHCEGIVEFVARYRGGRQHERSVFQKRAGRWFYLGPVD